MKQEPKSSEPLHGLTDIHVFCFKKLSSYQLNCQLYLFRRIQTDTCTDIYTCTTISFDRTDVQITIDRPKLIQVSKYR